MALALARFGMWYISLVVTSGLGREVSSGACGESAEDETFRFLESNPELL